VGEVGQGEVGGEGEAGGGAKEVGWRSGIS
jgi:hypothetical protein